MDRLSVLWAKDCMAWMGVVGAPEEVRHTEDHYRSMRVGIAEGGRRNNSAYRTLCPTTRV